MLAAINGNIGLIQLFLRYKTMRDQQGRTALIHAVLNKQWFVLELNMLKEEEPILDAVGLSFQDLKENK